MTNDRIEIVPIRLEHVASYREGLGSVARERRWLLLLDAPPLADSEAFVRSTIERGAPQFVALDGERVVGWCDVVPKTRPGTGHVGVLGMGVVAEHRGRGLGGRLLAATVERAFEIGLTRIELEVFASNRAAIRLYERSGFEREGVRRRAYRLDDREDDFVLMARLRDAPARQS